MTDTVRGSADARPISPFFSVSGTSLAGNLAKRVIAALWRQRTQLAAAHERANWELDRCWKRFDVLRPKIPAAMMLRGAMTREAPLDHVLTDARGSWMLEDGWRIVLARPLRPRIRTRAEAGLAAANAYRLQEHAAREASGLSDAEAAFDEIDIALLQADDALMRSPPLSLDDVILKARLAALFRDHGGIPDGYTSQLIDAVLALSGVVEP